MRRPRRPFGLRARVLLALVATASVTLVAAALALFGPLQMRLRDQQATALKAAALSSRPQVEAAIAQDLKASAPKETDIPPFGATYAALVAIFNRTGGQAVVTDGNGRILATTLARPGAASDVFQVLAGSGTISTRRDGVQRVASPLQARPKYLRTLKDAQGPYYVLALRQPDTQVAQTVAEVRNAFLTAAIIGLGIALGLGLVLSATLTRRLDRLRRAAQRITAEGMDAPTPIDNGADAIGDLSRAMSRMQEGLRRQEGARRQFVATASHELRTPLTSLSGNLELLGEDLAAENFDREDARRQIVAAQGQLARMRNLAT